MARMRTIKPEFWDSPSTAQADLAVRLTYLAMWNWADDSGHGTGNMKELEAFAFPNDEVKELPRKKGGNSAGRAGGWENFAEICGEVVDAYGVVFYRVNGRPFYRIPSFSKHQSKDFRKTSKHPQLEEGEIFDVTSGYAIKSTAESPEQTPQETEKGGNSAGRAGDSAPVIGEQGNRVIGEQGNRTSDFSEEKPRHDVEETLDRLDEHCASHDFKKPNRTKGNLDAARLLIDNDKRTPEQIIWVIEWLTANTFWTPHIRNMTKLREKFDQLKGQAMNDYEKANTTTTAATNGLTQRQQENYEVGQQWLAKQQEQAEEVHPAVAQQIEGMF